MSLDDEQIVALATECQEKIRETISQCVVEPVEVLAQQVSNLVALTAAVQPLQAMTMSVMRCLMDSPREYETEEMVKESVAIATAMMRAIEKEALKFASESVPVANSQSERDGDSTSATA